MNPFTKITSWKRKDFTPPPSTKEDIEKRFEAETETFRDLQKPIQQLLSDAHEEAKVNSLVGVNKRMVALLAVTAYETRVTNWWIKTLTIVIAVGTIILVCIELFKENENHKHHHHHHSYFEDR